MAEVDELIRELLAGRLALAETRSVSYQQVFERYLAINPHAATVPQLMACASKHGLGEVIGLSNKAEDRDNWLELLMSQVIEPALPANTPVFIYDFPASQASLAQIRHDEYPVAERFELYLNGMELANGFHELSDASEQRQRFENDNRLRQQQGKQPVVIDDKLLAAIKAGLPDCAGVALGLDRLLMLLAGVKRLEDVLSFSFERA
jgi:lysyl-tRNA synthetase class 2